jgi:outer membrane protein, heavy metal efflux system
VNCYRITLLGALFAFGAAASAQAQAPPPAPPAQRFLTLQELERLALEKNPTVGQADAIVRSVLGRRSQTSVYPNPIVGYSADDITARNPDRSKHFLWAQQSIITGGKRRHVQAAVEQERIHAEAEKDMQRQRVLNAVRVSFYEVLGLSRLVEIRRELAAVAREAVGVSEELFNVGQADRPDVLEVGIEAQRTELELTKAENDLARAWADLALMVGDPDLPITPLAGDLEAEVPAVDEAAIRKRVLEDGPELKIARARVAHAKASLARARADRIPNFFVRGGAGYNFDKYGETSRDVGPEFRVEIGVPLPIFDRNAGNISTAEAQIRLAEGELRRAELSLRQRLAGALRTYRDAVQTAEKYRGGILAQAQQSYELYRARFGEMAAAYPQVLIARRNLGQLRVDYVRSLVDAWQHAVLLDGLLVSGGLDAPAAVPGEPPVTIDAVPFTTTP